MMLLVLAAQAVPATQGFVSGQKPDILSLGVYGFINHLVGLEQNPISYQFWFIRDLIMLVLVSPLLLLLLRYAASLSLLVFSALWFLSIWPVYIPSIMAVFFFYAGAYIATHNISMFAADRYGRIYLPAYGVVLLAAVLLREYEWSVYIHHVGIILGMLSALYITLAAINCVKVKSALLWLSGTSFFVFAIHEPLLTIVRKIVFKWLEPSADWLIVVLYLAVPGVVIVASIIAYMLGQRILPGLMKVVSGGR